MTESLPQPVAGRSQTLDVMTLPLHGHRLIEASAGTGKTFTIAALYLRLLLGHGQHGSAHQQPLTVDQILVVTFTAAATDELRDRIRTRIHQARQAFLKGNTSDPILQQLLVELDNHPRQAERLLAAERQMDEAAIFTIHGFCQRLLKQHAFESGTLFTSELMENQSELIAEAVADFWRCTMYPLAIDLAGLIREIWPTPAALEAELSFWLNHHDLHFIDHHLPRSFEDIDQRIQVIKGLKRQWRAERHEIHQQLEKVLKKNSKSWKRLEKMDQFVDSEALVPIISGENSWYCFTPEALESACSKGKRPPDLAIFQSIAQLSSDDLDLQQGLRGMILHRARQDVGKRLIQRRLELRKMSFDDLLTQLANALTAPTGSKLAQQIRDHYRVGLIDEFQDTDAVQYCIFSHIYPVLQNGATNSYGLFLIGDPKQAIYAFRGADVFTYIHAKHQIKDHYTLPTNWRSSQDMIQAVNHLFAQAASPFIYDNDIPFQAVGASDKADQRGLFIDNQRQSALQFWCAGNGDVNISKGAYEQTMAQATAEEINRLLTLAKEQRCLTGGVQRKPLIPSQVAILVRTGHQAARVRQALIAHNIASVYLSDRSSVFDSPEATDVCRLLAACLEPTNERQLRAALATPLLALDAHALDALNNSEQHWEEAVEEFSDYQHNWQSRGVLPMLGMLIARRRLAENLLVSPDGERRLTNILHLGQLLAAAARERETPHALLRWFQERIADPDINAGEQQLHLESERDLVQIITVHKAKGLEYGVVFLPFVCTWRQQNRALFHNKQHQMVADLLGSTENIAMADQERLAEDLRLLYVALTRSIHACYLGVGPVKLKASKKNSQLTDLDKSALGHLLRPNTTIEVQELHQALETLAQHCPAITVTAPPKGELPPYQPPAADHPPLTARPFTGQIARNWWMTSYSALSRNASHGTAPTTFDATHEQSGLDLEVQGQVREQPQSSPAERPPYSSLLDFPRGAQPGTFLHEIFERIPFEDPNPAEITTTIQDLLLVNGFDQRWLPVLTEMVDTVIQTPIHDSGMKLSDLTPESYKSELEFNLPLGLIKAAQLNSLLKAYDPLAARSGELNFHDLQGMLKGFIDLTFAHNGRWYVLDWKSNWLADTTVAYTREAMAQAMCNHRYDLQYLIYTLALHRLLKSRLPGYDYNIHMGGAFYVFLRGVQRYSAIEPLGRERTGIYYHRPNQALIEALDRLFQGSVTEESTGRNMTETLEINETCCKP